MMSGSDDALLTPKQAAARLQVSESTIYREVRDGVLPGRMVRGKLRLYWPEVLRGLPAAPVRLVRPVPVFDVVSSLKLTVQGLKRVERVAALRRMGAR